MKKNTRTSFRSLTNLNSFSAPHSCSRHRHHCHLQLRVFNQTQGAREVRPPVQYQSGSRRRQAAVEPVQGEKFFLSSKGKTMPAVYCPGGVIVD